MESIDELIPLTAEDLKKLEADKKNYTNQGCAGFTLFMMVIAAAAALFFSGNHSWLTYFFGAIGLLLLALSIYLIRIGPVDKEKIVQDIAEGKKRRIVAPVQSKDIVEFSHKGAYGSPNLRSEAIASVDLKYSMTINGIKFPMSENDYLSRFKKGTFVEFEIAPNSQTVLSPPTEVSTH